MCRTFEDQLNESKNRANELQRQLTEVSAQKARALSEAGRKHTPNDNPDHNNMLYSFRLESS